MITWIIIGVIYLYSLYNFKSARRKHLKKSKEEGCYHCTEIYLTQMRIAIAGSAIIAVILVYWLFRLISLLFNYLISLF